ncbi:MAG: hypothetical protein JXA10_00005 [Anaerolineae bacterium]|nr:hypothetical protein [Anaerolineae bacterium]
MNLKRQTQELLLRRSRQEQPQEVGGSIAYHNLTNWWCSTFTAEERAYISHQYQPWGEVPYSLTEGEIAISFRPTAALLVDVTHYLNRPEDRHMVRRILEKAEQEAKYAGDVSVMDDIYRALMDAIMFSGNSISQRTQTRTRRTKQLL